MKKIRVVIIDDHQSIIDGYMYRFSNYNDIEVVGTAKDGIEAESVTKDMKPDIVILNFSMPYRNGLETIPIIRQVSPESKILMVTMRSEKDLALQAIKAGAIGYVLKYDQQSMKRLAEIVYETMDNWIYISSEIMLTILEKLNILFSPLEREAFLEKIHILNLSGTKLRKLPVDLTDLPNVAILDIRDNALSEMPPKLNAFPKLREVIASGNKITKIPIELKDNSDLKILDLRDNKLNIPPEILKRVHEPQIILDYYFTHIQKTLNELKMLVVGQGSVGKTSIVQRILHGTFDENQTKTEGISINRWQVGGSQKRKSIFSNLMKSTAQESNDSAIRLNIWDFGGQEIMHATHQFFLTKRSLYLLVLDARLTQEENRVEYWLKIIQSFGGESPVLIVGNKTDQHPLDIDRTGLGKKYPNIVGILETSAATGAGIAALKVEIAKQVDTLPHVRDLLPETWFTVKSKLEELGREKNFITQDEYLGLCGANDVTDETSQHTLIGFLHDLGVVLHFQDDPRLEALGILNPQWVTNGVYKILNSHELFQNQGTLTLPILNKTLNPPEYPSNKRLFIVDMMKKFELCYDIEPDKSFLIPDLPPKDEIYTGEWDGALAF